MFKQKKSQVLLFFRIGRSFFCLFFFWFLKKNVGSGLILGSVGLRQYNNFFFGLREKYITHPVIKNYVS